MSPLATNVKAAIAYAKQILSDVEDAEMCQQPAGLNHAAWLLAHLAMAVDYASTLLGGQAASPPEWKSLGDTKKPQSSVRSDYPSKERLIEVFEASLMNAAEQYDRCSPEELAQPQKLGFYECELPTVGDMATFLILAHTNLHLGQLSAWRRAMGRAPLF